MRKKIIVNAMNKRIVIDNPNDIRIIFNKRKKVFKFKIKIDEKGTKNLARAFKKISGDT